MALGAWQSQNFLRDMGVWESAAESEFCCVTWVWERVLGAWRPEAESEFLRGVALQKGAERPVLLFTGHA